MSRPPDPCDNAQAVSFMKTLKVEEVYLAGFETLAEVTARLLLPRMDTTSLNHHARIKSAYWRYREEGLLSGLLHLVLPPNRMGDTLWSAWLHHRVFGELPRLRRPRRFNEHIVRLKLSEDGRSELRARISDKELVKDFIRERLGDGRTAQTYAVLRSPEEVRSYDFPAACAIKATHTSGDAILRCNGEPIDHQRIAEWFRINYYEVARESNYRNLEAKVIVEELLSEPGQLAPPDYKVHCFAGIPAYILVISGRFSQIRMDFFSPKWMLLAFRKPEAPLSNTPPDRPASLDAMLSAARTLSAGFSFLRVDFFQVGSRLVVGELTNLPAHGISKFIPDEADFLAGRLFDEPSLDAEILFGVRSGDPKPSPAARAAPAGPTHPRP